MSKSIVVLSGSPRKKGNTDKLAAAFIDGARSAGKEVALFRVADMKIHGCQGCGHCRTERGVCVQKDDMPPILDALHKADALVLASPVYYFGVTAQLKLAVDRLFALDDQKAPIKRIALLMTCGDARESVAQGAIVMLNEICDYYAWTSAGVIVAAGFPTGSGIDIEGREELERARALGREI